MAVAEQSAPSFTVEPSGGACGARISGLDLTTLDAASFAEVERLFHRHEVVAFSDQKLDEAGLIQFARRFGPLERHVSTAFHHPGTSELTVLSNLIKDGKNYGSPDAGQGWHTDMSYNELPARATILHGLMVPMKDGKALGDTLFASMTAAYEALPAAWKTRIARLRAEHDYAKFYNYMIDQKGSDRPKLGERERREKPPVVHPLVVRHPWTGRVCLYCDPGYTIRVLGVSPAESEDILDFLFAHQTQDQFRYSHSWRVNDVLMWDNIATIHMATGGYDRSTPRLMHRAQVLGNRELYSRVNL